MKTDRLKVQYAPISSGLRCSDGYPMHYYCLRMPSGLADAAAGERVVARWGEVGKNDGVPHVRVPRHEIQVRKRQREGRGETGRLALPADVGCCPAAYIT